MTDAGPRPLIGLYRLPAADELVVMDRDAALVPGAYLHMVVAAGGWPVVLPPPGAADGQVATADGDAHAATAAVGGPGSGPVLDALDGLVVIGGGDVAARRYGQGPDPRNAGANDQRDELELQLLAGALDRDLPVLAICRGPPGAQRPPWWRSRPAPARDGGVRRASARRRCLRTDGHHHRGGQHGAAPHRREDRGPVQPPPGSRSGR